MDVWAREVRQTQEAIARLAPWPQNVRLPNGVETAPEQGDHLARIWEEAAAVLPADLSDQTVLDAGCQSGFFSFAAASRGARVIGVEPDDRFIAQARWLRRKLGYEKHVRLRRAPVYSLAKSADTFDTVLLMGGFSRLRYPTLALDLAVEKAQSTLVFRDEADVEEGAHVTVLEDPQGDGLEWRPTPAAAALMIRHAGATPRRLKHGLYVCDVQDEQPHRELLAATGRPVRRRLA